MTALVCAGFAAAVAYAAEPPVWLEGLLFDAAVAASASARDDAAPAVAVVAIDARSLDSPELTKYPRAMFGPIWAQTIAGLQKVGAKAIAFDMVLAFSGNRIKPRFDNSLMRALAGANDLVVLGRSSRMLPLKKYYFALDFDPAAFGLIEVTPDKDAIIRRIPSVVPISNGDPVASLAGAALARGEHAFDIKVGVNTGPAVVGNVGSDKRFNYTAVGEAVNIAARPEGLPGVYRNRIIIGPETSERIGDRYRLREIDAVTVKGKDEPLRIYEPAVDAPPRFAPYEKALALYRDRQFSAAAEIWETLAEDDGPSAVMAERARNYALDPPPEDWDGVFAMTGK